MANYFENVMNSIGDSPFSDDIVIAARDMLVKALDYENNSTRFYEMNLDEENGDDNGIYWRMSCEASARTHGLVDAYELLTNREVFCCASGIRKEIEWLEETFIA